MKALEALPWCVVDQRARRWLVLEETWTDSLLMSRVWASLRPRLRWRVCWHQKLWVSCIIIELSLLLPAKTERLADGQKTFKKCHLTWQDVVLKVVALSERTQRRVVETGRHRTGTGASHFSAEVFLSGSSARSRSWDSHRTWLCWDLIDCPQLSACSVGLCEAALHTYFIQIRVLWSRCACERLTRVNKVQLVVKKKRETTSRYLIHYMPDSMSQTRWLFVHACVCPSPSQVNKRTVAAAGRLYPALSPDLSLLCWAATVFNHKEPRGPSKRGSLICSQEAAFLLFSGEQGQVCSDRLSQIAWLRHGLKKMSMSATRTVTLWKKNLINLDQPPATFCNTPVRKTFLSSHFPQWPLTSSVSVRVTLNSQPSLISTGQSAVKIML